MSQEISPEELAELISDAEFDDETPWSKHQEKLILRALYQLRSAITKLGDYNECVYQMSEIDKSQTRHIRELEQQAKLHQDANGQLEARIVELERERALGIAAINALRAQPPSKEMAELIDASCMGKCKDPECKGCEALLLEIGALEVRAKRAPEPREIYLPVITVQMVADFGVDGLMEKTDAPVNGVPGVTWSQTAVDFAAMLMNLPPRVAPETEEYCTCPADYPQHLGHHPDCNSQRVDPETSTINGPVATSEDGARYSETGDRTDNAGENPARPSLETGESR